MLYCSAHCAIFCTALFCAATLLQISQRYRDAADVSTSSALSPHVYALAEQAYRSLVLEATSQCCVISGESGAGKTESSKYFVQHILNAASSHEMNLNSKIQQVREDVTAGA